MADKDILYWSRNLATSLLECLGDRWLHTQHVIKLAMQIACILPDDDSDLLVAAAYLHDIGYAPSLSQTGFHPIDGAYYIEGLGEYRLASIVAYHSGSRFTATMLHMSQELSHFPYEHSLLIRCLNFCDMHSGPSGQPFTLTQRRDDILARYGRKHVVSYSFLASLPSLRNDVSIVQRRLKRYPAISKTVLSSFSSNQ